MFQKERRFLMVLGAMKAGTSALFHGLSEHPHILGSLNKEPAYWIKDAAKGAGVEPYLTCWDASQKPAARWWMEASTDYAKVPVERSPAPRLRHIDADLRFLFVTRNPVDRVRSNYEMALAHGWIQHPIHVELDPTTVWFSNYYQQVKPFVDCFGRDSVHVLSHEQLMSDSRTALDDICAFLDVDPEGVSSTLPRVNEAAEHRGIRRRAIIQRARAAGIELSEEALQERLKADITPTPGVIEHLHAELDHDLGLFREMFGLDPWTGLRDDVAPAASAAPAPRQVPALSPADPLGSVLAMMRGAA